MGFSEDVDHLVCVEQPHLQFALDEADPRVVSFSLAFKKRDCLKINS